MTPPSRQIGDPDRGSATRHPEVELGAYLLAALPADQEATLERHLLDCPRCQQRLCELSEVLPALAQVPIDAAIALADASSHPSPPACAPGSAPATALARAGGGWRVAAAAGAAAAAVLVAVAMRSGETGDVRAGRPAASASIAPVSLVRVFPYTGDDQVTVRAWNSAGGGAEVTVQCHNDRVPPAVTDPAAAVYELWAVRDNGVSYLVSSWKAVYGDDTFPGRLDFPVARIKSLELRSAGAVLSIVQ